MKPLFTNLPTLCLFVISCLTSLSSLAAPRAIQNAPEKVTYHAGIATGSHNRSIELIVLEKKQIILFYGGFTREAMPAVFSLLSNMKAGLDTHLYLERGYGGSVADHKDFVEVIKSKCKNKKNQSICQVTTYLDGKCSPMCTTLFLAGDKRVATKNNNASLGFHRTLISIGKRRIPIQTKAHMVRYFSRFNGVNKSFLRRNKHRLFGAKGNKLSYVSGEELIEAGFAHQIVNSPAGRSAYLKDFHDISLVDMDGNGD